MTNLKVADGFELPIGAVVQKMAILARSGAGKTNTAVDIVEELLAAGQQVVIVDPPGAWWGLRSSADGKRAGYPVVVAGGPHQDLPLEPAAGALWADLVVDHTLSAVLDLSDFTDGEIAKFVAKFAERLYARKNTERTPLLLVLEEADELAPQNLPKTEAGGQALMLHHVERIAKRGRGRGIGMLAITQRSAALNKHVLSQIEVLIAMQTTAPQDISAIDDWVKLHGDQERRQELLREIAGLPIGTGFVWSPSWLQVFQRVSFRKRRTFDSSATPEPGETRVQPKKLAEVDLAGLRDKLAASIDKAKAEDPVELRRQVADLQRQLREQARHTVEVAAAVQEREVPVLSQADVDALRHVVAAIDQHGDLFRDVGTRLAAALEDAAGKMATRRAEDAVGALAGKRLRISPDAAIRRARDGALPERPAPAPRPASAAPDSSANLAPVQQKILDAAATLENLGVLSAPRPTVGALSGYSATSGYFKNTLGNLRSRGLITYPNADSIALTDAGHAVASPVAELSTVEDLHAYWYRLLSKVQIELLRVLIDQYPQPVSREELGARSGYSPSSGYFKNTLGSLRTIGLIAYPDQNSAVATDLLFPNLTSTR